jgi:hypothetical protein
MTRRWTRWALVGVLVTLAPALVEAQSPAEFVRSGHVRIEATLDREAVLVGQRAVLRVKVLTRTWYLEAPAFPETLTIENAIVLRPDSFAVNSTERNGRETFAAQTRSYAVFPVSPGTLEIPPIDVVLIVARDDASRSDPITLTTPALRLRVSIPEAARGLGLVVATPDLDVEQAWEGDRQGLRVGDALRRSITQRVTDSVAMVLPRPSFVAPQGTSAYPDRPEIDTRSERGALSGTRTDAVTYVFETDGEVVLPDIEILWWNLDGQRLEREVLTGTTITVAANPDLAVDHLAAPEDAEADAPPATGAQRLGWPHATFVAAALVILLILARYRQAILDFVHVRLVRENVERDTWRDLQRAARTGEPATTFNAVLRWLDAAHPGGRGWRSVLGVDTDTAAAAHIEALEGALYADGPSPAVRATPKLLSPIRRQLRRRSPRPSTTGAALGPLNPG